MLPEYSFSNFLSFPPYKMHTNCNLHLVDNKFPSSLYRYNVQYSHTNVYACLSSFSCMQFVSMTFQKGIECFLSVCLFLLYWTLVLDLCNSINIFSAHFRTLKNSQLLKLPVSKFMISIVSFSYYLMQKITFQPIVTILNFLIKYRRKTFNPPSPRT